MVTLFKSCEQTVLFSGSVIFTGGLPIEVFYGVLIGCVVVYSFSEAVVDKVDEFSRSKFNFSILCTLKSAGRCQGVAKLHILTRIHAFTHYVERSGEHIKIAADARKLFRKE